jgi:hypothetical protein
MDYPVPDELGKSAAALALQCDRIVFFRTVTDVRGRNALLSIDGNVHPSASLLEHLARHGAPVHTDTCLSPADLEATVQYGCHGSAMRDVAFVRKELAEQTAFGHVMILPF